MICVVFAHAISLGIAQSNVASTYDIFLVINSLLIIVILAVVRLSEKNETQSEQKYLEDAKIKEVPKPEKSIG